VDIRVIKAISPYPKNANMKTEFEASLIDIEEVERLKRDFARRFKKKSTDQRPALWKLSQYHSSLQTRTLLYYRLSCAFKIPVIRGIFRLLYQKYSIKTGIEFTTPAIGGGMIMPHWGRIILNAKRIGNDLYVFHNVTIGNDYITGKPVIGDNVFIGTNSVILGDITIGDNVVIGACSFVNQNIPSNSMAAGNPAKVIKTISPDFISEMIGY
jgi:serine acetyltransferase